MLVDIDDIVKMLCIYCS